MDRVFTLCVLHVHTNYCIHYVLSMLKFTCVCVLYWQVNFAMCVLCGQPKLLWVSSVDSQSYYVRPLWTAKVTVCVLCGQSKLLCVSSVGSLSYCVCPLWTVKVTVCVLCGQPKLLCVSSVGSLSVNHYYSDQEILMIKRPWM